MRIVTAQQMRELDRRAVEECGIPALCLMENAGRLVAEMAVGMLKRTRKKVLLICGTGNNGGDGLVAARHLLNYGVTPVVRMIGDESRLTDPARINLKAARNLGISFLKGEQLGKRWSKYGLIVDAFLGIGLCRDIDPPYQHEIEMVNSSGIPVLAVDVPSGLDATTGKVCGACVKADVTITFGWAKSGLYRGQGSAMAGKVAVVDIGIPWKVLGGLGKKK